MVEIPFETEKKQFLTAIGRIGIHFLTANTEILLLR